MYSEPPRRIFSLDVECVANGVYNSSRIPARVAVVDEYENIILDCFIKPTEPVTSYLTGLTGLTKEILDEKGEELDQVLRKLKAIIKPANSDASHTGGAKSFVPTWEREPVAVLVGQGIGKDIMWMGLVEGVDYFSMYDIAEFFAHTRQKSIFKNVKEVMQLQKSFFSLRHLCQILYNVDIQSGSHDPGVDALYSMKLYRDFCANDLYQDDINLWNLRVHLDSFPRAPSFVKSYGSHKYEGVCINFDSKCPDCKKSRHRK